MSFGKHTLVTAVAMVLTAGGSFAGETVTYRGTGTYIANALTMTLGSGDVVFGARNEGIATISTDPPILLYTKCMGLGLMTGEDDYSADVYCTLRANDEDSIDVKGRSGSSGGAGEVIGGSGHWAGASGTVTMIRERQSANSGEYRFELSITTP